MLRINYARVAAGGVLAGTVHGVIQAVLIPRQGDTWREALAALGGRFPELSVGFMVSGTLLQFGLCTLAVWLYAVLRRTYGAGPGSAVLAALFVWAMILVANLSLVLLTNVTLGLVAALHGPNLVTVIAATLAGAWLYRDPSADAAAAAFVGEGPTQMHATMG